MTSASVLVVEDDLSIAESVALNLREEGFDVTVARRGDEGLSLWREHRHSLLVLDLMLPGISGQDICRIIRRDSRVPILILSARSRDVDKVTALELGADDYLTKPFSMVELIARVKALIRRATPAAQLEPLEVYEASGVTVDVSRHRVLCDGQPVALRPKEFELLRVLIANRGRVIPRARLMELVWGDREASDTTTLEVHIRWLREHIERNPSRPSRILTVRGTGYQYASEA